MRKQELLRPMAEAKEKSGKGEDGSGGRGNKNPSPILAKGLDVRQEAAKEAGVSHGSLSAFIYLEKNAEPEELAQLKSDPNAKLHKVVKTVKERKAKAAREEKRLDSAKDIEIPDNLIIGDFREHAGKVPDATSPDGWQASAAPDARTKDGKGGNWVTDGNRF